MSAADQTCPLLDPWGRREPKLGLPAEFGAGGESPVTPPPDPLPVNAIESPPPAPASLPPEPLAPSGLDAWMELGRRDSPELRVRQRAIETARADVARNRAGHMPRVDLVASISQTRNDTVNTLNSEFNLRSIGVQVSLPIYSGGSVVAGVDQALANLARAEAELENEVNTQMVEVRRQYLAVVNGLAKMSAYEKAAASSDVALEGTRQGLRAGIRTNLDVLDAQRQVFQARRDLAQARYQYLLAMLRLKSAAGQSLDEAIGELDKVLVSARSGS